MGSQIPDDPSPGRYAPSVGYDLADVERELCRIPEVRAARIVADRSGQPIEVHVLATPGKHAKQVVRDIQSVAMATVGLSIDHRIVSVVQLDDPGAPVAPRATVANGTPAHDAADEVLEPAGGGAPVVVLEQPEAGADERDDAPVGAPVDEAPRRLPASRVVVDRVLTLRRGVTCTAEVVLRLGDEMVTGDAEGSVAASATLRLVAEATLDALRQLHPAASRAYVETASVARVSDRSIALSSVVLLVPPNEDLVTGSAPVRGAGEHEAIARSVLDAMNRRIDEQRPPSP